MQLSHEDENNSISLSRFESMLRTNKVLFFDSEEFEEIILHYLDMGKASLAKKALKLALEQHPKSTGLRLVQVEMLIYDNKFEMATRMLNELQAIEPTNEEVYIQRASIHSKRDEHDKAIEQLKIALKYTDDLADVYNLLGMEYLLADNLEQARHYFEKCLEEDIMDQSSLYNVVYCYEFTEQYEPGVRYLENYIEKNPYSEIAWHQMGRFLYEIKKYNEALNAFDYAVLIDDQFVGALLEKGKCLEKLSRYEEAIACYERSIEMEDPTSYAFLRLGKCHEKLGNKKLAINFYSKAVHEDPLLDKGWIAITDFYIRQRNYQKALFYVNKALSIDNENSDYWKRYASINRIMNFYEEAEYGYRKAVEYGDCDLDTWFFWAELQQFLGEFDSAIQTLHQAALFFPENDEVQYRLAGLYLMLMDNEKGIDHLQVALHMNPDGAKVFKALFPNLWRRKIVQQCINP